MSNQHSRSSTRPSSEVERNTYANGSGSATPNGHGHCRQRSGTLSSIRSNGTVRAPLVSMDQGTSPLAKVGIKGDGLMLFVTCFASLGVFLFGYDQGVMSGIITGPYFKAYFGHPTAYEIGTLVASLELGALVTSLACGRLADIFGRKNTLFWGAVIFSAGGAVQTFTSGYGTMLIGRVISGLGVGVLSMIVPTYQSEISPAENRGKLACIEFTGNIIGYASSVWVDYAASFIESDMAWRLPLSLQVIIGTTLAVGSVLLPESPRWLLDKDMDEEGMRVLADLHGAGDPNEPRAKLEFREIKENVLYLRKQGDNSYKRMFTQYRYRTLIAMSSQAFAQLVGINSVCYYLPMILESAGWIGRDALLMTGVNAIIYTLATVPTWFLVDLWGRRAILLSGAVGCGAALTACGYFLYLDKGYTPQAVVGSIIVYMAWFGYSWGPIPWLYPPEIMPLAFRAKGASLATATNWSFNWLVGELTPILMEKIGWKLYIILAFFALLAFIVVYFGYPETSGVPLEEIGALFGDEITVPQDDDDESDSDDDEERAEERRRRRSMSVNGSDGEGYTTRPIRRSISSHPRLQSEEERAARAAAARVAAEERRAAQSLFVLGGSGSFGWIGRLLGGGKKDETPDRRLYEEVRRDEH
ncbi:related to sugar transport protein [Ustilago bromivora]|uniref:Related to sugar transport protein n=1 Tax=Ustilago bromivora TaxID=307758 RepID=A0A1K0GGU9_9BASI|nr:related to sugar transport protein [Ustilago bromivora]SYW77791.1 related to sugar transport protein [Ustilago bromivora]